LGTDEKYYVRDLTIDDEYDTISADKSVKDAASKMKEAGIPDLVVTDNNDKVLGIIADFDIVTGLVAEGLSAENAKVTEIMYTIEPVTKDTPISVAFARMRDLDVSVVPVIDDDKLMGVATITDCWGLLPEKYEDQKGLIAISNPRLFNYGFSLVMTLLYFCFGILAPLTGLTGFIKAPVLGSAAGSQSMIFYLFEARGGSFWERYLDFPGDYSLFWLGIMFYGVIFIVLGVFSAYAIFHWAYADYQQVRVKRNWQYIGLVLGVLNLIIIWFLFIDAIILGALRVPSDQISLDFIGLFTSIIAIIFLVLAVSREILFRESTKSVSKEV
jgi:CBS domain-containing protein